ncbi:MAG: hypothetical protein EP346_07585 [Bacteroidetes bacterium]|nr:MAG: hypothetical protein EP346_07585 [Bacteroidota bacterium]
MTLFKSLAYAAFALTLSSCNSDDSAPYQTLADIVETEPQNIPFNADEDAVIEGREGVVIAIPKGGLIDKYGDIVTGHVSAVLVEALTPSSQIFHELALSRGDEAFENIGAIQLTFTSNGSEVFINPKNPVYAEIPSTEVGRDLMVYSGERKSNGDIAWKDSTTLPNYLINIPFELLTFTPPNFERTVQDIICPSTDSSYVAYNKDLQMDVLLTEACDAKFTKEELDSLYFSIVGFEDGSPCFYHDPDNDVKYLAYHPCKHILPRSIFTIRQSPFNQTFIATREFEQRLKTIHQTQNRELLEIYINNLDKHLWKVDEMAHSKALELFGEESEHSKKFHNYANEKLTNVADAPQSAKLLAAYYERKLDSLQQQQARLIQKLQTDVTQQNKLADSMVKQYVTTVVKRNRYRLKKYGFTTTSSITLLTKKRAYLRVDPVDIKVKVNHSENMHLIRSYIVLNTPKSILKLNNLGTGEFSRTITVDAYFNTSTQTGNQLVTIGFSDNTPWLNIQPIELHKEDQLIHISLEKTSDSELSSILRKLDQKKEEFNKIEDDIRYHLTIHAMHREREKLIAEQTLICKLYCAIHEVEFKRYDMDWMDQVDTYTQSELYISKP